MRDNAQNKLFFFQQPSCCLQTIKQLMNNRDYRNSDVESKGFSIINSSFIKLLKNDLLFCYQICNIRFLKENIRKRDRVVVKPLKILKN